MKLTYHQIRLLIALLLTGAVLATACGVPDLSGAVPSEVGLTAPESNEAG